MSIDRETKNAYRDFGLKQATLLIQMYVVEQASQASDLARLKREYPDLYDETAFQCAKAKWDILKKVRYDIESLIEGKNIYITDRLEKF